MPMSARLVHAFDLRDSFNKMFHMWLLFILLQKAWPVKLINSNNNTLKEIKEERKPWWQQTRNSSKATGKRPSKQRSMSF